VVCQSISSSYEDNGPYLKHPLMGGSHILYPDPLESYTIGGMPDLTGKNSMQDLASTVEHGYFTRPETPTLLRQDRAHRLL
jgi:hypothetical protein